MKLAIITSSIAPYPVSGAERQAAATAVRLARRGYQVTVFARHMLKDQPPVEEHDGVRWVRCRTLHWGPLRFPSHVVGFLRAWNRESKGGAFDCILTYQMVINGVLGRLASRRSGASLVYWVRSEEETQLRISRNHRFLSPWVLKGASQVLAQAEGIRKALIFELRAVGQEEAAEHVEARSSVLPNAVEVPPGVDFSGREGLVCLGRLVPTKGLHVLFEALRLMEQPPPVHILGDGPLRRELEEQSRDLPVSFWGYCPGEEVSRRLSRARVLVSPSFAEGFPNALLEGMAHGVPAVATDVGGVSALVRDGENGYLLAPGDARILADKLSLLLSDDALWRRLAENAYRTAGEYAWDPHLDSLEAVLRRATGTSASPSG